MLPGALSRQDVTAQAYATHIVDLKEQIKLLRDRIFGRKSNFIHEALLPMGKMAGIATVVLRGIQMVFAGCASALVGALHVGSSAPSTASVMTCFAAASVAFQWWTVRQKVISAPSTYLRRTGDFRQICLLAVSHGRSAQLDAHPVQWLHPKVAPRAMPTHRCTKATR